MHPAEHAPTREAEASLGTISGAGHVEARTNDALCAPPLQTTDSYVREPECRQLTGLSRVTRWRLEREGRFPRRRRLSSGAIGWLRSEIAVWITSRQAA